MTFRLLSTAIALAVSAHAQNSQAVSFEQSYQLLEKRIEQLKAKGEKISDQSLKELDALLVQMNHQRTELKRELDKKTQEINAHVETTKKGEENWSRRAAGAYAEVRDGFKKAWNKLSKDEE